LELKFANDERRLSRKFPKNSEETAFKKHPQKVFVHSVAVDSEILRKRGSSQLSKEDYNLCG
jgi:hypothetical protein